MFPKVVQVISMKNYAVYVYLDDRKIVCYDMYHMLDKEAFGILRDTDTLYELPYVKEQIA